MNYESIENIERSIIKFSFANKLSEEGLLTSAKAKDLASLIDKVKIGETNTTGLDIVYGALKPRSLGSLRAIFGEDQILVEAFFSSPTEAVSVLALFNDTDFWENHDIGEIAGLGFNRGDSPADRILAYIQVFGDIELFEWFGSKEKVREYFFESLDRVREMEFLFDAEKRKSLVGVMQFGDYQKMCKHFGASLVHSYPDLAREIVLLDSQLDGWAGAIVDLKGAFWELGMTGQDRDELKAVVMGLYKQNLITRMATDDFYNRRTVNEEVSKLKSAKSSVKDSKFIESVAFSLVARRMDEVKSGLSKKEKSLYIEKEKQRMRNLDIEWEESRLNPINKLRPLIGYEIEFDKPPYMDKNVFDFFAKLGFKNGGGGSGAIEISPGPFASHRTASQVFWAYVDAGVIDLYERQKQSVHLNIDLKTDEGVAGYMRWLILTGWASMPVYQQDAKRMGLLRETQYSTHQQGDNETHSLRINRKNKDDKHGHYIECKEFDLVTAREFVRFLRVSQGLATGLAAWQRIDLMDNNIQRKKKITWELGRRDTYHASNSFDDFFWDTSISTKIDKVWNSTASDVEKRLAITYLQTVLYLWEGLNQVGMGKFLKQEVGTGTANRVVNQMLMVHPTYWDHYGVDHESVEGEKISFRGKGGRLIVYNNPVVFARKLALRACGEISRILENHHARMINDLRQISLNDEPAMKAFFKRYPESFPAILNYWEKYQMVASLLEHENY